MNSMAFGFSNRVLLFVVFFGRHFHLIPGNLVPLFKKKQPSASMSSSLKVAEKEAKMLPQPFLESLVHPRSGNQFPDLIPQGC